MLNTTSLFPLRFNARTVKLALLLAAVSLIALTLMVALPAPKAEAHGPIWSATMKTDCPHFTCYQPGYSTEGSHPNSTLSDDTLTYQAVEYTVKNILLTQSSPPELLVTLEPGISSDDKLDSLVITFDSSDSLSFADRDSISRTGGNQKVTFTWNNPNVSWTDQQNVSVEVIDLGTDIWKSNLTVEDYGGTADEPWLGYHHNRYGDERGSLSDKTFTWKGDTYTVRWLYSAFGHLRIGFTSGNSGKDARIFKALRDLTHIDHLWVGDKDYHIADATGKYEGTNEPGYIRHLSLFKDGSYKGFVEVGWKNQDAPWADGDTVNVRLTTVAPNKFFWEGATSATVISGNVEGDAYGFHGNGVTASDEHASFPDNPFNKGGYTWEVTHAVYDKNGSNTDRFMFGITSGDEDKDREAADAGSFDEFNALEVRWWDANLKSHEVTLNTTDALIVGRGRGHVIFQWSEDDFRLPTLAKWQRFRVKLWKIPGLQTSELNVVDLPTVSSVEITSDPGQDNTYAAGENLELTATFSETVNVIGTPQLALTLGRQLKTADYDRGSGTNRLVFVHTVAEGDQSNTIFVPNNSITLNSGSIKSATYGFPADLAHTGFAIANQHIIDGVKPTLESAVAVAQTLTLNYSENLAPNSEPATSAFSATVAGATRAVNDVAMSGNQVTLTLASAVAQAENVTVSYTPPTGDAATTLQDLAGNQAAALSNQAVTNQTGTSSQQVLPPTISSVEITSDPGSDNTYAIGEDITVTATFNESVRVTGQPQLALSIGDASKTANAQADSSTTAVAFTYTVVAEDHGSTIFIGNNAITLNNGTIKSTTTDAAANLNHRGLAVANLH